LHFLAVHFYEDRSVRIRKINLLSELTSKRTK
jgi:hypothetical protein